MSRYQVAIRQTILRLVEIEDAVDERDAIHQAAMRTNDPSSRIVFEATQPTREWGVLRLEDKVSREARQSTS